MIASLAGQLGRAVRDRRPIEPGVRILTYHGVVERRVDDRVEAGFHLLADFRAHLQLLRWCHVIPLDAIGESPPRWPRRPRVAITFDDGFRNNLLAAELVTAAKLPMTIFVSSGNVTRREAVWPTLLRLVLACTSRRTLVLAGVPYRLDADAGAFAQLRAMFKGAASDDRRLLWSELVNQLPSGELAELTARFPSIAMMSWDDARSLAAGGIAIGSHGAFHELHHAAQSPALCADELARSKAEIEHELGRECTAFAFPNGAINDRSAADVRAAGYARGFTMLPRAVRATDDAMLLPRLVPGNKLDRLIGTLLFGNEFGGDYR